MFRALVKAPLAIPWAFFLFKAISKVFLSSWLRPQVCCCFWTWQWTRWSSRTALRRLWQRSSQNQPWFELLQGFFNLQTLCYASSLRQPWYDHSSLGLLLPELPMKSLVLLMISQIFNQDKNKHCRPQTAVYVSLYQPQLLYLFCTKN